MEGVAVVMLAIISIVSTTAAIWFYVRGRGAPEVSPEAVYRLLRASPIFREGLTEHAADGITKHLRGVLGCIAVGVTDAEGTLLSWDGGAGHHFVDLVCHIDSARRGKRQFIVAHDFPGSDCGSCGTGAVMIVPLIVSDEIEAFLLVLGMRRERRLKVVVGALAQFVCIQLELSQLTEAKGALQRAEVKALRAQISPHFVHNALNTIAELIRRDPEQAEELLQDFAEFTRYAFRASTTYTELADELRNVGRYLAIETAVRGGRLGVRLKVDPEVLTVVVPFLVLQPLVENAIKHGLAGKPGGGTVTITAEDAGTEAVVSVEDDGVGMNPERLRYLERGHRTGDHLGIGNINERMRTVYGEEYALVLESAEGVGTKVTLRLPKFNTRVRRGLPDYFTGLEEAE